VSEIGMNLQAHEL